MVAGADQARQTLVMLLEDAALQSLSPQLPNTSRTGASSGTYKVHERETDVSFT